MNTKQTETLQIEGMSCGHCVKAVENALRTVPGTDVEAVEIGSARVSYDPATTRREQIVAAVEDEGYTVRET